MDQSPTPTLSELIQARGLKKNFVAQQMGIDRVNLHAKLKKPGKWTVIEIEKIAGILATTPDVVFHSLRHDPNKQLS
jgi:DNA-binding Xre family transcriptional regulator